ncbi:hypothetical protein A4U88_3748 [Serratia marcescens]|nr:hypothetical protein A4U88_3748 [Serratia marcescens]
MKTKKNAHLDFQKICATTLQNVDFNDKKGMSTLIPSSPGLR